MAYISTDDVKAIRAKLKETFPDIKFSVKNDNHSAVSVSLMKGPHDFSQLLEKVGMDYAQLNPYHTDNYGEFSELFTKIVQIIKTAGREWYDESDIMTDYFNTAFYINLNIGQFEKPYVQI